MLHAKQHATHQKIHRFANLGLCDRLHAAHGIGTCIVEQDIEAPEALDRTGDHVRDVVFARDISTQEEGVGADARGNGTPA
jgi:hypothetical protein